MPRPLISLIISLTKCNSKHFRIVVGFRRTGFIIVPYIENSPLDCVDGMSFVMSGCVYVHDDMILGHCEGFATVSEYRSMTGAKRPFMISSLYIMLKVIRLAVTIHIRDLMEN